MSYRTVGNTVEIEFTEKKSVFIGLAKRVFSEEDAKAFIDETKTKYRDARHHVYAYTVGEEMNIQRYNDDGEPSGTGGIPILEVIKKNELRNVCIVVVRYFGGILLGAGGLTRAYVKGASLAISGAGIIERVYGHEIIMVVDYDQFGKIQHHLKEDNIEIVTVDYTDKVKATIYTESEQADRITAELMNLTSGSISISIQKEELFYKDADQLHKGFEEDNLK